MTILYHNPKCSKSREAKALLEERGIDFRVIEYLKTPLDATALRALLTKLDGDVASLVRPKELKEAGVDMSTCDEDALLAALALHPAAMQRPVFVVGDSAVIGRPPQRVLSLL